MACTASAALEATLPYATSIYAEEGAFAHKVCELLARKKFTVMKKSEFDKQIKKLKSDKWWADEMLKTAETYVDHLYEHYLRMKAPPAIAFEVRVDLSEYVPGGFGACDCLIIGNGELIVTDYKHGKGVPVAAENNKQMMLYALGALHQYRPLYGDGIQRVSFYIDQPRLDDYNGFSMTAGELLAWGETVVKPLAQTAFTGKGAEYVPGEHCQFCRAKDTCRARAGACTALEDFTGAIPEGLATQQQVLQAQYAASHNVPPSQPLLTDTEIGDLITRGKLLKQWYSDICDYALQACLAGRVIPGYKAVEGRSSRAWTDQDAALAALVQAGIDEAVIYERVAKTLAQLEAVVGKKDFEALAGVYIHKPPGKPTLAPENDKRPAYNAAVADFAGVA
jgi:hypothetical protein